MPPTSLGTLDGAVIELAAKLKAENNSEKLANADNLFMSEIEAGNEKAACIYAYQLFRENKKEYACQIMASCPDDKDNLKKACGM